MKWLILLSYLIVITFRLWLRRLNLNHLAQHGHQVPRAFEGFVDQNLLSKTTDYTLANSRIGLIESILSDAVLVVFLFGGLLSWYDGWISTLTDSFIGHGVLFVLGLTIAQTVLDIPFSLYRTFVLEERFQFNTSTPKIWFTDLMKSLFIGTALLALVMTGVLSLVQASPDFWWLWVWVFLALITLLLMYLSLQIERVQQVDASRRSKHSNAYFTGIGRVKRIVLFDTLLEQMDDDEIIGVLAHEAGHWKLGHIWKRLLAMELVSLAGCWLAWYILGRGGLPGWFGLDHLSFVGQLVLLGFLASLAGFPLTPLSSWLSRRHEWQADRFAVDLTGESRPLSNALVKLSRENLSNLHPHPHYAWFYYSHPPVTARIARLAGRVSTS
ncbi:MAG: M48 family metallopeptidase [Desulfuromonadales bacterium]